MRTFKIILVAFWQSEACCSCLAWGVSRKWLAGRHRPRYTPMESIYMGTVASTIVRWSMQESTDPMDGDSPITSAELELLARELATNALESVLPYNNHTTTVSAEKALRHTLRSLPSKFSTKDRHWMRARLSKLILGTSIMRLRHEYIFNATTLPNTIYTAREKIWQMVEQHARYLRNGDELDLYIDWPVHNVERLCVKYSFQPFLIQDWINQYGVNDTEKICMASNRPGPITLRWNALKCPSYKHLIHRLAQEEELIAEPLQNLFLSDDKTWKPPVPCLRLQSSRPHKRSIWSMPCWKEGWFEVQDVGSQLIVRATEAKAGEVVVDYCAGNGGKTSALASTMFDDNNNSSTSTIWAHDIVVERLAQIKGSLERAGLLEHSSVQIRTTSNSETDFAPGMADVVLVDAPCSSSGVLRRRPSHRWVMTKEDMCTMLPELQLDLLRLASKLVKPNGGRLVYATCSISKWENQNVVQAWETEQEKGKGQWLPWDFEEQEWPLQNGMPPHCRALLPHLHDSDGFFVARWKRN